MAKAKQSNVSEAQAKLEKLATQIKTEHERVVSTYRKSLEHAKKMGELLSKTRDLCHTSSTPWKTWLEAHTGLSRPSVNGYIKVYEGWAKIEEAGEKVNTIKGALDLLKPARPQTSRRRGRGIVIAKSLLNQTASTRGLSPDLIVAILVDLGLKVEFEDEPAAVA